MNLCPSKLFQLLYRTHLNKLKGNTLNLRNDIFLLVTVVKITYLILSSFWFVSHLAPFSKTPLLCSSCTSNVTLYWPLLTVTPVSLLPTLRQMRTSVLYEMHFLWLRAHVNWLPWSLSSRPGLSIYYSIQSVQHFQESFLSTNLGGIEFHKPFGQG